MVTEPPDRSKSPPASFTVLLYTSWLWAPPTMVATLRPRFTPSRFSMVVFTVSLPVTFVLMFCLPLPPLPTDTSSSALVRPLAVATLVFTEPIRLPPPVISFAVVVPCTSLAAFRLPFSDPLSFIAARLVVSFRAFTTEVTMLMPPTATPVSSAVELPLL